MAKDMTKKELAEWMNKYRDLWIRDHNALVDLKVDHVREEAEVYKVGLHSNA